MAPHHFFKSLSSPGTEGFYTEHAFNREYQVRAIQIVFSLHSFARRYKKRDQWGKPDLPESLPIQEPMFSNRFTIV
jgi:hypothetical protein